MTIQTKIDLFHFSALGLYFHPDAVENGIQRGLFPPESHPALFVVSFKGGDFRLQLYVFPFQPFHRRLLPANLLQEAATRYQQHRRHQQRDEIFH